MMRRSLLRLRQLCLRWVLGTRGCAKKMAATMATKSFTTGVDLKGEEGSISRGSIEVCRLMAPDDANIAGNVHGGTTLKVIEEAGIILATRHAIRTTRATGRHMVPWRALKGQIFYSHCTLEKSQKFTYI